MTTQTEILERQEQVVTRLETDQALLHQFIHGQVQTVLSTESGPIPTLAGLVEEIRQRAGFRRIELTYSVEQLLRYENKAEALMRMVTTRPIFVRPQLEGSHFRLDSVPGGTVEFEVIIGDDTYTVTFVSGASVGVVTGGASVTTRYDSGTTVRVFLKTGTLSAAQYYHTILAFAENPEA